MRALICLITLALASSPALAQPTSFRTPLGQWELSGGESRYTVVHCGDGTDICAMLTWLRDDLRTADNLAGLNKYLVRGAREDGANTWRGQIVLRDAVYEGTMALLNDNYMRVVACRQLVCRSFELKRR